MTNQSYLLPPDEIVQVANALQYLAGQCDGAVEQDGVGFNKIDSRYGKQMAEVGTGMTPGQAIAANKMLQKYRVQLANAGINIPDENELEIVVEKDIPKTINLVALANQRVMVYFEKRPDEKTREHMKQIEDWRWDNELQGRPWSFPARTVTLVLELFEQTHKVEKPVYEMATYVKEHKQEDQPQDGVIKIYAKDERLLVYFPGFPSKDDLAKIKSIPSRQWEKNLKGKPWSVSPVNFAPLVEAFPEAYIDRTARDLLDIQNELRELGRAETSDFRVPGLNDAHGTPRPYQWAAMEFMEKRGGRAGIADDQGLGKCLETLGFLQLHPDYRPAVIISPSSVKTVWKREAAKWLTTKDTVEILQGQTPYETTGSILIINYEILQHWADHIRFEIKPQLVVADESHYLKNPESLRSKAAFKVVLGKERKRKGDRWSYTSEKVPYFLPLTGTPITNKPMDIWTTLHLLDPDTWKNKFSFAREYGMAYQGHFGWKYDGKPDVKRLHQAITPYFLRRKKSDVLKELPPKMHIPLPLELSRKYKVEYAQEVNRVMREIEALKESGQPVGAQQMVLIEKLKQITARGKMEELKGWIADVIENEKLLVLCTHTATIDFLMTTFTGQAVEISGRVPPGPKRDAAMDAFMDDPKIRLCAANIIAGGVGLTLTSASKALFVEFPWNPKDLDQASDRIHRFGQTEQVMIYYACAADTIDEGVVEILIQKANIIDQIMDGEAPDELSVIKEVVDRFMRECQQMAMEL